MVDADVDGCQPDSKKFSYKGLVIDAAFHGRAWSRNIAKKNRRVGRRASRVLSQFECSGIQYSVTKQPVSIDIFRNGVGWPATISPFELSILIFHTRKREHFTILNTKKTQSSKLQQ